MNGFSFGMAVAREGSGFFRIFRLVQTLVQNNTNPSTKIY